jgi:hypothetical protein
MVGEVRVLEAGDSQVLKRVLSTSDMVNAQSTRGLCCVEFRSHLQVNQSQISVFSNSISISKQ